MGGSDQWGNITAGIDLIRKLRAAKAHGLVLPLMTTATARSSARPKPAPIWLDAARTSPYQFYQFWLNTDDRDVVTLPEVLHVPRSRRRSTRSTAADARRTRTPRGAARAGARGDDAGARRGAGARGPNRRRACCLASDIADARGRRRAGGVSGCAIDRASSGRMSEQGIGIGRSRHAREARGLEERCAAADSVGRCVCEQSPLSPIRRCG